MNYFLDRAVYGSNSLIVDASKPLGKGAQATVYACKIDGKPYAAKIFHSSTHGLNVDKINAMIDNSPDVLEKVIDGVKYPKYSWPLALIRNQSNSFIGYLMPLVDLEDSFTLDHYYDSNLIKRLKSSNEAALSFKVEIAKNLAEIVADLHSHKHYFVDFKPQNIRVFKGTHAVTLIDCDGFSINGRENAKFPAELMSTDYIAPEVFKNKLPAQQLGEEQDLYALATIIFQLLNGGIHPFQGILKNGLNAPTNDEKASLALYPHGINPSTSISPRPQSVHASFLGDTRVLFDKAFVGPYLQRPTANMWFVHLSEILDAGKIVRCSKFPTDVKHMRFKNMDCPECHRQEVISVTPQVPKSKIDYSQLNTSRPSGFPYGGHKPPSSTTGVSGWNAFSKVVMIFIGAMILVAILSNCENKSSSTYSNQPPTYTPPPAYTPPVISNTQPNQSVKKPWQERVNEIREQIKRGEIPYIKVNAEASRNKNDLFIFDKSKELLPSSIAASMEGSQTWFVENNKLNILVQNDSQETIVSLVLTAYEGFCETKKNPVYIHLFLYPKLNPKSKVVYNVDLPISNWSYTSAYRCIDIDFAYRSAGVEKPPEKTKKIGWASIYYSPVTKKYSWSIGNGSEIQAKNSALESCNKNQGSCKEWATRQAKCFSIFANRTTNKMSLGFGSDITKAMNNAETQCQKEGGTCVMDDSIGVMNSLACDEWSE